MSWDNFTLTAVLPGEHTADDVWRSLFAELGKLGKVAAIQPGRFQLRPKGQIVRAKATVELTKKRDGNTLVEVVGSTNVSTSMWILNVVGILFMVLVGSAVVGIVIFIFFFVMLLATKTSPRKAIEDALNSVERKLS